MELDVDEDVISKHTVIRVFLTRLFVSVSSLEDLRFFWPVSEMSSMEEFEADEKVAMKKKK